jgi:hypothetical protein
MPRLVELKVVLNEYSNSTGFSGWIENASEDELMDVAIAFITRARGGGCSLYFVGTVFLTNHPEIKNDYRHLMKTLKSYYDSIINNNYYGYDYIKFAEGRRACYENVLTKLHEMKLLK